MGVHPARSPLSAIVLEPHRGQPVHPAAARPDVVGRNASSAGQPGGCSPNRLLVLSWPCSRPLHRGGWLTAGETEKAAAALRISLARRKLQRPTLEGLDLFMLGVVIPAGSPSISDRRTRGTVFR